MQHDVSATQICNVKNYLNMCIESNIKKCKLAHMNISSVYKRYHPFNL
jgi:hypothetical protein